MENSERQKGLGSVRLLTTSSVISAVSSTAIAVPGL